MNWRVWTKGMWEMAKDAFCQKILAYHLPARLSLPNLTGLSCVVTGATSGIGLHTARELAMAGAHVIMACRNTRVASELAQDWQRKQKQVNGSALSIEVMELDLLSLGSVRQFAASWESRNAPLHLLINNAGILRMGEPRKFSRDGIEQHMQVNHVGPALLSILLLPSLLRGAPSRILNVNSVAHHCAVVDPLDLNADHFKQKKFNSIAAYGASKLAHLMFLGILSSKLPAHSAVHVIAVHPGVVCTNLVEAVPSFRKKSFWKFDAAEGARSVLFCATTADIQKGQLPACAYYCYNCKPAKVSAQASNVANCLRIWDKTLELLGISMDCIETTFSQIIPASYSSDREHTVAA